MRGGCFQPEEKSWAFLKAVPAEAALPPSLPPSRPAGRAWLYLALNENSLESYLRLFQENRSLLHKYYVE